MYVYINNDLKQNYEYYAFVSDPAATNPFQLPDTFLAGDKIKIETSFVNKFVAYTIQLKETAMLANDESCVDYPNLRHETYSDCVVSELTDKILPVLGCMVPWMSFEHQCNRPIRKHSENVNLVEWIVSLALHTFGGIQYKSGRCPLPCTVLSAYSTHLISGNGNLKTNFIELFFKEAVIVENIVLAYDSTALLVEIGSCLGLWLGLSVVGVFDLVVHAVVRTKLVYRCIYHKYCGGLQ